MNRSAMRTCRACLLMTMAGAIVAVEHRVPEGYEGPGADEVKKPLPIGIETTLEVPRGPILMGSGWVVNYVVTNRGEQPFRIELGGDYRGPRPTKTWLEALDPAGVFAQDPLRGTQAGSMGGIGIDPEIKPGQDQAITVNPRLYARLDRPGRWTLRVFHSLGLGPAHTDRDPRWAEAVVDLAMPDDAQAVAVLAEHEARLGFNGNTMGRRGESGPDFAAMSLPIYLPLLEVRARQGSRLAIDGLAGIRSAAAVEVLLGVLERPEVPRPEREAAYFKRHAGFWRQHPHAAAFKALGDRLRPTDDERGYLGEGDPDLLATMDPASIARLRRLAGVALRSPDPDVRETAAIALARIPEPQDAEALLAGIDRAADGDGGNALHHLLIAWRGLGQADPPPASRPAAALIWIDRLTHDETWRPEGWREVLSTLLTHAKPRVREQAVRGVPEEEPERWAPFLVALLKDPDEQVRWSATAYAWRCRHPSLLPGLRAAMDNERTSGPAAVAIGAIAGREAEVLAWIDQIADGTGQYAASYGLQFGWRALTDSALAGGWLHDQPPPGERKAIAARLRAFVTTHRQAIAVGQLTKPEVTWPADLLPDGWYMELPGGGTWPPGRKKE